MHWDWDSLGKNKRNWEWDYDLCNTVTRTMGFVHLDNAIRVETWVPPLGGGLLWNCNAEQMGCGFSIP